MADYHVIEGNPLKEEDKEKLRVFLRNQELDYDEQITYSYLLMDENRIIATGSCSGNIIKCVAVDPAYQGQNLLSDIITNLVKHLVSQGITHYFGFTKPKNKVLFGNAGLYPVAETKQVLLLENRRNGLQKFVDRLVKQTAAMCEVQRENAEGSGIGAIVANCNPFTKGHQFLIEKAAADCRWLHVFILADENQMFTQKERIEMVRMGTSQLSNVLIHDASDYVISAAVFPTYFIKDKVHAYEINCSLDIKIFGSCIAGALGITKRYVGTEPHCGVTATYNQCLSKELPQYGITYCEIERVCSEEGVVVSASAVRRALEAGNYETVREMTNAHVYNYIVREKETVKRMKW